MTIAVLMSHPIQYYSPILRELARRRSIRVFFATNPTPEQQGRDGFGHAFSWDIDLVEGYDATFLTNIAKNPNVSNFFGCDTPDIGAHLKSGEYSVLLVFGWYLKAFVQGITAAKRLGIPVVARGDSHLGTPRSMLVKAAKALIYPPFLRQFDLALYVGQRSRQYWEHYAYPKRRLIFSPHCVDSDWFAARATSEIRQQMRSAHGIAPDDKLALFAGKLEAIKRPSDLLHAAARLKKRGSVVTVMTAGSGHLQGEMSALADRLGVKLVQLGFRNQTGMPSVYAAADVLVLPSERESWGLVANEALACGTPIIVSDACGCSVDLARDGAGLIYPAGDRDALAGAMENLLNGGSDAAAIKSKIALYSVSAAVNGIETAIDLCLPRLDAREQMGKGATTC